MSESRAASLYRSLVVEPGLERFDLLRLVRDRTGARTVLYPGSSVHVTPSRLFGHVVYVDRSELARAFFADPAAVLEVVRASAAALPGSALRFLHADFKRPLPLPDGGFDLLLALGAGGVTLACGRHVRPGGFVLSDDHEGDALAASASPDLSLVAAFVRHGRELALLDGELEGFLAPRTPPHPRRARGPRRAGRPPYRREAEAYLFVRTRAG